MYFLLFLVLLLSVFVVLIYLINLQVNFTFNTNSSEMYICLAWLRNFIKVEITIINFSIAVKILIRDKNIYTKILKKRKKKDNNKSKIILNTLDFKNSYVDIYYGFDDPFNTGIASGILQLMSLAIGNMIVNFYPNFIPEKEYIIINANTEINMGRSINNYIHNRKTFRINKRSNNYGTV